MCRQTRSERCQIRLYRYALILDRVSPMAHVRTRTRTHPDAHTVYIHSHAVALGATCLLMHPLSVCDLPPLFRVFLDSHALCSLCALAFCFSLRDRPAPKGMLVTCSIERNRSGISNKLFPQYELYLDMASDKRFLLAAKKRSACG
jgi:hypothetical protein